MGSGALPTGDLTFWFTDIEGSTRLLTRLGDAYAELLEGHAAILRRSIAANEGHEVSTEGDAFFAVFATAADAVRAATQAQLELAAHPWRSGEQVRVRIGMHTGEARLGGDNYVGLDVHRAARIAAAGHGGQVLLSAATATLVESALPPGVTLRDLGEHRLKDLDQPERISQLVIPGLDAEFPPLRAHRPGKLPSPATSLVGRERELAEVARLLAETRLVTLLGPGGAGKTRLALAVAEQVGHELPDGAAFVPLDAIREAELVPSTIATALELREGEESAMATLRRELADRTLLLVMDNCEQVLEGAAVVDGLLKAASGLRVLATSRTPLQLYGEQQYPLPPLSVPAADGRADAATAAGYASVLLFVERARAVRPAFALTDDNAPAVAEIARRLDGLPLALELAAARVKLLTPQAILTRLGASLDLLASTASNLPARQRTLRGAIGWSWELLDEPERRVLERLSVFAGGCDLDTAESVADPDGECGIGLEDAMASLVDKSLVIQDVVAGEPRFRLLETIREFGLEQLAERGETDLIHRRLTEHVASAVEEAEPLLNLTDDEGWFDRLDADYDNIRAALRWAIATPDAPLAFRIVGAVWRFWQRKGLLEEADWWIGQVLVLDGSASALRARAISAAGSIAYWREDYAAARSLYEESLAIYNELRDASGIAWATYNLGFAHLTTGDVAGARERFADSLDGFRALGDDHGVREVINVLGWTELILGDLDAAETHIRESLRLVGNDTVRGADFRIALGQLHRLRREFDTARQVLRESLRMLVDAQNLGITVGALALIGTVDVEDGRYERGLTLLGASAALHDRVGGGPPQQTMMLHDPEEKARAAIGDAEVERFLAAGRVMSEDKAVRLALAGD